MHCPSFFRRLLFLPAMVAAAGGMRAERMSDLVEIHVAAIGGRERIEALQALRATGRVVAADRPVSFVLLAARPNRVRLETEADGRAIVQGFDGVGPAWESDLKAEPARQRAMGEGAAKIFVADAEFDDPLISGARRGYAFDYSGEVESGGRRCFRVLVYRHLTESFSLLIDATTYLIVTRIEERRNTLGRKVQVVTEFADFRPVDGVLLAHQMSVSVDGRRTQTTEIERIEPNPSLAEGVFSRSKAPATGVH